MDEIKKAMERSKHSIEMEGSEITPEMDELVRKSLKGEITDEEFEREAVKLSKRRI